MTHLLLILILAFCIAVPAVWALNWPAMNPLTQPMSAYLSDPPWAPVKYSWLTDVGFLCLAAACPILGFRWGGRLEIVLGVVAAIALFIVTATKVMQATNPNATRDSRLETFHVYAAKIAFISVAVMILAHTWHSGWVFWMIIGAIGFDLLYSIPAIGSPKFLTAVEERVTTAAYMVALFILL